MKNKSARLHQLRNHAKVPNQKPYTQLISVFRIWMKEERTDSNRGKKTSGKGAKTSIPLGATGNWENSSSKHILFLPLKCVSAAEWQQRDAEGAPVRGAVEEVLVCSSERASYAPWGLQITLWWGCPKVMPKELERGQGCLFCPTKLSGFLYSMEKVVEVKTLLSSNSDSSF